MTKPKKFPSKKYTISIERTAQGYSAAIIRGRHTGVCNRRLWRVKPCGTMDELSSWITGILLEDDE